MNSIERRRLVQWFLLPVVIVTIALGWKYRWLGFSVPIVMIAGLAGSLVSGRWVCGNLCPRGGLLDRIVARISLNRPIPRFLAGMPLRWLLFAGFMALMVFQLSRDPGNPLHWGYVFWLMCTVTTAVAALFGVLVNPRIWCAVCPMGTMQNAIGGHRRQLVIDPVKCRDCCLCEKACPIGLEIVKHKESGSVAERDCLKCSECIAICPAAALGWPDR